uniref:Uncharacterized protein n=1 Tax=Dromaius novaehollandiae TaxID=8790 RepID=A0A8C4K2M7_DRONO
MPQGSKGIKFSQEEVCFAYLKDALCLWSVLETHPSSSVLFHGKGPDTAVLQSSFGARVIDLLGTELCDHHKRHLT